MAWLNLTMSNQTVKKGIKAEKIKLLQMNFFLEKQLIKFSCAYWLLSFCKIFKNFLGPIQSYEDVPYQGPRWPISHEQFFFWYKLLLLLSSTYWLFSLCGIFKKSYSGSRVTRMRHFQAQNGAFAPNNFFWKIINIILNIIYLLVHFIVQNFKKIFQQIQSYEDVQFLGPK